MEPVTSCFMLWFSTSCLPSLILPCLVYFSHCGSLTVCCFVIPLSVFVPAFSKALIFLKYLWILACLWMTPHQLSPFCFFSSVRKSHLVEEVVRESRHPTRRTHVFHGLVPSRHVVVTDGGGRHDVSIAVIVTFVAGGRLNHHRGDRHVFLSRTNSSESCR